MTRWATVTFVNRPVIKDLFSRKVFVLSSANTRHVSPKMRVAIAAATQVQLRIKNGKYEVDGHGSEAYMEFINISNQLFSNNTFYITNNREENFQRLATNQSDFLSALASLNANSATYSVPVPMVTPRIGFLTGYSMYEKSPETKECADVFGNFTLLKPSIYAWSCLLILLMMLVVFIRTSIRVHHFKLLSRKFVRLSRHPHPALKTNFFGEVSRIFYGKSRNSKLIGFSFVLLSFYLVKFFGILYKTSHIIMEEPFVVRSYQDLLSDKDSLPGFYDAVANVSRKFRDAPSDSLRGKIWAKLINSKVNLDKFIRRGNSSKTGTATFHVIKERFREMNDHHYVLFSTTDTLDMLKRMYCSTSDEGKLRRMFVFIDRSEEEEDLQGFPMSIFCPHPKLFARRIRRLYESLILFQFKKRVLDDVNLGYILSGADKKHQNQQNLVCSEEYSFEADIQIQSIKWNYFSSFFYFIFALFHIATATSVYEVLVRR